MPGFEAGLGICFGIGKQSGLVLGAGWGVVPFSFQFKFKAPFAHPMVSTTEHDLNHSSYIVNQYVFPVSYSRIFSYKRLRLFAEAGLRLHRLLNYPYSMSTGYNYFISLDSSSAKLFYMTIADTDSKHFISGFLRAGIWSLTDRANTFSINGIISYCPQQIGAGSYSFFNLPYASSGRIRLGINHVGLELTYGFTLRRN